MKLIEYRSKSGKWHLFIKSTKSVCGGMYSEGQYDFSESPKRADRCKRCLNIAKLILVDLKEAIK